MAGAEYLDKIWNLRYQELQPDSGKKGEDHELVGKMFHVENRGFHIPHTNGMEELRHAEHGKGVGLGAGENPFIHQQRLEGVQGDVCVPCKQETDRELKKGDHADKSNQSSI